jgi:hypothetical protein
MHCYAWLCLPMWLRTSCSMFYNNLTFTFLWQSSSTNSWCDCTLLVRLFYVHHSLLCVCVWSVALMWLYWRRAVHKWVIQSELLTAENCEWSAHWRWWSCSPHEWFISQLLCSPYERCDTHLAPWPWVSQTNTKKEQLPSELSPPACSEIA